MTLNHILGRTRGLILAAAAAGCLTGCTSPDAPSASEAQALTGGALASAETGDGLPARGYAQLRCPDVLRASEPVDLLDVGLSVGTSAPGLTVRFVLSRQPQSIAGVLELAVGLYDRAGTPTEVLAMRFGDGRPRLLGYVPATGNEQSLPGTPAATGTTVTATFPVDPATLASPAWQWRATAEVDGSTVGACPAA